jgi:hypothetical protein
MGLTVSRTKIDRDGSIRTYNQKGQLHSFDGKPAIDGFPGRRNYIKKWYKDGKLHNDNGKPAIEYISYYLFYTDGNFVKSITRCNLCKKCGMEVGEYREQNDPYTWYCYECNKSMNCELVSIAWYPSDEEKSAFLEYVMERELAERKYMNDELNEYMY